MTTFCQICGREFKTKLSRLKNGRGKTCSKKCFGIAKSKMVSGSGNHFWKGGKADRICEICGKHFLAKQVYVRKGIARFCSNQCQGKWLTKTKTRENSPLWKGGTNPIPMQIRASEKYKSWRSKVFIRDDFTCQDCGYKGKGLEAHHKKPFHKLLSEAREYLPLLPLFDAAMVYTPLWDLSNGETLCAACHSKIDKRRGLTNLKR